MAKIVGGLATSHTPTIGFAVDTNEVKILFRDGQVEHLPLMGKEDVAGLVLDWAKTLWNRHAAGEK